MFDGPLQALFLWFPADMFPITDFPFSRVPCPKCDITPVKTQRRGLPHWPARRVHAKDSHYFVLGEWRCTHAFTQRAYYHTRSTHTSHSRHRNTHSRFVGRRYSCDNCNHWFMNTDPGERGANSHCCVCQMCVVFFSFWSLCLSLRV